MSTDPIRLSEEERAKIQRAVKRFVWEHDPDALALQALGERVLASHPADDRPTMEELRLALAVGPPGSKLPPMGRIDGTIDRILEAVEKFWVTIADDGDEGRVDEPEIAAADGLRKALSKLVRPPC